MKTLILLAAVALLAALAADHSDTEQSELLVRDARDASPRKKIKKGFRPKKNKKGRRMNKKRSRKAGRRGNKGRASTRSVDAKCIAQLTLAMRRWKDVVTNYKRQSARITDNKKKGGNKADKKGLFAPIAHKLVSVGGGNKSALECMGVAEGDLSNNFIQLAKDLFDCEKNVNASCNPENFPKPNETLITECDAMVEKFEKEADKCMKLSKEESKATEGCACWTADDMVKLTEDVDKCKVKADMDKIKDQLKSCTKAFGACRKLEDSAVDSLDLCTFDLLSSCGGDRICRSEIAITYGKCLKECENPLTKPKCFIHCLRNGLGLPIQAGKLRSFTTRKDRRREDAHCELVCSKYPPICEYCKDHTLLVASDTVSCAPCDGGFSSYKDPKTGACNCYKAINNPSFFFEANYNCITGKDTGVVGQLASAQNIHINEFLTDLTDEPVWIGGYRTSKVNSAVDWGWSHGDVWDKNYTSWAPGQPDNEQGLGYVLMLNYGGVGLWNDVSPLTSLPYICQAGKAPNSFCGLGLSTTCPPGYTYFAHNCKCFRAIRVPGSTHIHSCSPSGGVLASIHDQKTNDYLATLVADKAFIGLYRILPGTNAWAWLDGSAFDYSQWSPGNPDDVSVEQNSVVINFGGAGLWDDQGPQKGNLSYICQAAPLK